MTKLWMRMQSQNYSSDKEKRERERLDLRTLIGTNLGRLANLDGVDAKLYSEVCSFMAPSSSISLCFVCVCVRACVCVCVCIHD